MLNSSLLEILRALSEEEILRMEDFVNSPYHNKIGNTRKLFTLIKRYYPQFDNDDLTKEKVWNHIFPGKEYNYGTMKNLVHELTKLAENFLVTENSGKNEFRNYYVLIDELYEKGINDVFRSKLGLMDRMVGKYFLNNKINTIEEDFFILFNLYGVKLSSLHQLDRKFDNKKDVELMSELMISCFLIYCFKLYCNSMILGESDKVSNARKNIMRSFLKTLIKTDTEKMFQKDTEQKHYKIMNAYFRMFDTIGESNSAEHYHLLKESISEITKITGGHYTFDLFVNLKNSLYALKLGTIDFTKETYDIFNMRIENRNLVGENGILSEINFIHYLICAFGLNKPEDITKFTEKFLSKIAASSRENCKLLSSALIHFLEGDHERSLIDIAIMNPEKSSVKLVLKELQLMNFYELRDYESFLYAMDTYKHFVGKKNKPKVLKDSTYRFCMLIKKLFDLRSKPDQYELSKLKNGDYHGNYWNTRWVIEKIDELVKR